MDIIKDKDEYLKSEEYLRDHPTERLKQHYQKQAVDQATARAARQKKLDENPDVKAENKRWDHEHAALEESKINRSHILSRHQEHLNILYAIEKDLFGE